MTRIRINLLEGLNREVEEPPSEVASPGVFQAQILVAGLLVSGLLLAGAYWFFSRQVANENQQLEAEKREAARLSVIQAAASRYAAELRDINRRIEVLQQLENGRRGPEQLMTQLATMVNGAPELYLISVAPQGGRFALTGASNSVSSIARLVRSLQTGDGFADVQLVEYYEDDEKDGRVSFRFSVDFSYTAPANTKGLAEILQPENAAHELALVASEPAAPADHKPTGAVPPQISPKAVKLSVNPPRTLVTEGVTSSGAKHPAVIKISISPDPTRPALPVLMADAREDGKRFAAALIKISIPPAATRRTDPIVKMGEAGIARPASLRVFKIDIAPATLRAASLAAPALSNPYPSGVIKISLSAFATPLTYRTERVAAVSRARQETRADAQSPQGIEQGEDQW